MSKKHDAFNQVRIDPDNFKKLSQLRQSHPLKPSVVRLVNAMIRTWPANELTKTMKGNNQ